MLSFSPPAVLNRNGPIVWYKIYYQRLQVNNQVSQGAERNVTVLVSQQDDNITATLSSLDEFSQYRIDIEACNAQGCSERTTAPLQVTAQAGEFWQVEYGFCCLLCRQMPTHWPHGLSTMKRALLVCSSFVSLFSSLVA